MVFRRWKNGQLYLFASAVGEVVNFENVLRI